MLGINENSLTLGQLMNLVSIKLDGRGELSAAKLRAITVLTDLALPSMFSQQSYNFMMDFLGLPSQPYPDGLVAIRAATQPLLPSKYHNQFVAFIFPWVIYAHFSKGDDVFQTDSENIGEPPQIPRKNELEGANVGTGISYWLVYCNPRSWNFDEQKPGTAATYNSYYSRSEKRKDYDVIVSVKKGDLILAYSDFGVEQIKAVLKVEQGASDDVKPYGELTLTYVSIFKEGIPKSKAEEAMLTASGSSFPGGTGTFFKIQQVDFNAIIALAKGEDKRKILPLLSLQARLSSDQPAAEDYLGYKDYANAVASMILDNKTKPPLTIAIMAPWGQGKTTLMYFIKEAFDKIKRPHAENKNETTATYERLKEWINAPDFTGNIKLDNPTIWFNPWQYQSSEQIWAGMAHTIITQLVAKLTPPQQEEFWFKLQLARIDTQAIRREVTRAALLQVLPWLIGTGLAFVIGVAVILVQQYWYGGTLLAAISAGVGVYQGVTAYQKKLTDKLEGKYISYVKEPNYEEKLGLFHHINIDMQKVFNLLVGEPALIFIDDLDRCSPSKIVEVVEAMNLMVNGDFKEKCYFIVGMDHHVVAASLDVAYFNMQDKLKETGREFESVGSYFLDKFIQLPFYLPTMSEQKKETYLQRLLQSTPAQETVIVSQVEIEQDVKIIMAMSDDNAKQVAASKYIGKVTEEVFTKAFIAETVKANEDNPDINTYVERFSKYLSNSPRDLKRFANLLRFYTSIQDVRKLTPATAVYTASTEALAKWLTLTLRYPAFVRWIQWQREGELASNDDPALKAKEIDDMVTNAMAENKKEDYEKKWNELVALKPEKCIWLKEKDLMHLLLNENNGDSSLVSAVNANVW